MRTGTLTSPNEIAPLQSARATTGGYPSREWENGASMPRLRRVDCSGPGLTRRRFGRGFAYYDEEGDRIDDPVALERIQSLAIPPAWTDVWICPVPNGHIQAIGIDAAGRKQYRYHDRWRARKDQEKFDRMVEFARGLPRVREVAAEQLQLEGFPRERVLAGAVRLLDRGFFRIGGEEYAETGSYGLATMRKEHVMLLPGGVIRFEYVAKGGKDRVQSVVDPEVYELVTALKRRRGSPELLAYKNHRWRDVRSSDINDYIKEITGGDFSAKAFRTWNGTVLAAVALAVSGRAARSPTARKRAMSRAAQEVAYYLGNTPAVARSAYIDPRVFDRYQAGVTIGGTIDQFGETEEYGAPSTQGPIEEAVLDLLEEERSPALEKVA
jgi:DNA topoisomerase I